MLIPISGPVLAWYDRCRRDFPFRNTRDPYRIYVSEIMLQQTRTETVVPYYERFIAQFPTMRDLADADPETVLKAWEGLGYYSRAKNLHRAARIVCRDLDGVLPSDPEALLALPGIGPYTAGAIASIAFDAPTPALDGNLTRVYCRLYDIRGRADSPAVSRRIRDIAEGSMPGRRNGDFNQALMDLGATVCLPGTPDCARCPLSALCGACLRGDPEELPVKKDKKKLAQKRYAVVILTCRGRVCLFRRTEKLLEGLWVFHISDLPAGFPEVPAKLPARPFPLRALSVTPLGRARHVFTHQVWEMELIHAHLADRDGMPPPVEGGRWATAEEMHALPMPTAMRAAVACADALLGVQAPPFPADGAINSRT